MATKVNQDEYDRVLALVEKKTNFRYTVNRRSLRRVVKDVLAELGIEYTDLSFIDLRHRVAHTGMLGDSFRETFGHYANLIDLLDQIFLRILRYEGEHLQHSEQWSLIE